MAFLCPVRIRRNKKKKPLADDESVRGPAPSMGRITGSASIETLVRVGIEKEAGLSPESKMVVLHDFTPCVDDELEVKRGQVVHVLYQENDWVYVISEDSKEGFIPYSYCAQFGSQLAGLALNVKKKMPRGEASLQSLLDQRGVDGAGGEKRDSAGHIQEPGKVNAALELASDSDSFQDSSLRLAGLPRGGASQSRSSSLLSESSSSGQPSREQQQTNASNVPTAEIHPFFKDSYGRYIVLYSYHAQDENDLSVERGQCVTVLNKDDPEWFWVVRADAQEGFVPAGFVYPLDAIQQNNRHQPVTGGGGVQGGSGQQSLPTIPISSPASGPSAAPPSSSGESGPSSLSPGNHSLSPVPGSHPPEARYSGTELVMLYDYKAQAPDDLSVRRGEWVYADLSNQTVDGWLWAYAPKTRKYGFIPKAYARPPAMTSL